MVKDEIITVDKRFALWRAEDFQKEYMISWIKHILKLKNLNKKFFLWLTYDQEKSENLHNVDAEEYTKESQKSKVKSQKGEYFYEKKFSSQLYCHISFERSINSICSNVSINS